MNYNYVLIYVIHRNKYRKKTKKQIVLNVWLCIKHECTMNFRLPVPKLPTLSFFSEVALQTFSIAIVGFASTASLTKIYCLKYKYDADFNQVRTKYSTDFDAVVVE